MGESNLEGPIDSDGLRLFSAPRLGLLEAIAFAVHLEDVDMMGEAIEPRAGQTLVAEHGSMTQSSDGSDA
jgi:hypothetical protein